MANQYRGVLQSLLTVLLLLGIVFGGIWLEYIGVKSNTEWGTIVDTRCTTLAHGSICYSSIMTTTGENIRAISNCHNDHDGLTLAYLVGTGLFTGKTRYSVDCF